ncbi:hypothetical protein RD792_010747 [Penstemon davidsonii]|uniref:Protein LNK2 n=1 Tax=Penstemon davidsonii TaxID=160366 RepID=A0ABR0D4M1_9LAMI|nr:hypothetical protein RD792_010747 [Penstemon davidsonii]
MFDWNDEELTDIIWGEAVESDDQSVPYPDRVELKKPNIKSEHGDELSRSSRYETRHPGTAFGLHSSLSSAAKLDPDTMATDASNNSSSLRDDTTQFDKDSELFQNQSEEGEQGGFVDYDWANIGSFDDLDRIFSNDDPIFGDISGGNADVLWPSPKEVTSSPHGHLSGDSSDLPLGALRTSKLNEITSHTPKNVQASIDTIGDSGGKSKLLVKEKILETSGKTQGCPKQLDNLTAVTHNVLDKGKGQKRLLKGQKTDKESEVRQLNDLYGTSSSSQSPFPQVSSQYSPPMVKQYPPSGISQKRQLWRPESLQQKHYSGPVLASPLGGNMINYYPTPSGLAQFHPGEGNCELMSSGYEVPLASANSLKKSVDASVKPSAMTPKEKIEKLRRRQQTRAILAIQKQQQQFGNQVSVIEHRTMEGGSIEVDESLSSLPFHNADSPLEQDDSKTISMAFNNCSVEESVLYQLQDTIAKVSYLLDIRIRLCIRDSLFRLAESALQRQYPGETRGTNRSSRDEVIANVDISNNERMSDVETDTNPIDRTVAHLLFHRPLETPELPVSANFPCETKGDSLTNGCFTENSQMTSLTRGIFCEDDVSKKRPWLDMPDNASNNENVDGILEASK